ncbi:hypothetical protein ACVV2G_30830 [Streptomyces ziwulingensis]
MDVDFDAYPYGARYTAYLDHLLHCTECGATRCTVGADLCTRYLATAGRSGPRGAALSGPGDEDGEEEPH